MRLPILHALRVPREDFQDGALNEGEVLSDTARRTGRLLPGIPPTHSICRCYEIRLVS